MSSPFPESGPRNAEPTLAKIYDAILRVEEEVAGLRRQFNLLGALHVSRYPDDGHLFLENTSHAAVIERTNAPGVAGVTQRCDSCT